MTRRWRSSVFLLAAGLVGGVLLIVDGSVVFGLVFLAIFTVLAVLTSPSAFPDSITDAEARAAQSRDGHPIIYWRPGCPFCLRLRTSLARDAADFHWVDIWADPEAAASVRAVTGGDETVPTVVAIDQSHVNPAPQLVRSLNPR